MCNVIWMLHNGIRYIYNIGLGRVSVWLGFELGSVNRVGFWFGWPKNQTRTKFNRFLKIKTKTKTIRIDLVWYPSVRTILSSLILPPSHFTCPFWFSRSRIDQFLTKHYKLSIIIDITCNSETIVTYIHNLAPSTSSLT